MFWTGPMIAFFVISLAILACAVALLSARKVIYMAVSIGGVFIGCSAIYLLLGAEFVGIAQILIYAGAITILIMFAIMLTNHEATEPPAKWTARNVASALFSFLLGVTLLLIIRSTQWPQGNSTQNVNGGVGNTMAIGLNMFQHYVIPFELVSLLLIVALVGAVVLAQGKEEH